MPHGVIQGSFVPPAPIQESRDLTRTRKQLVREIARHTYRLQKTLEDANVEADPRGHRHHWRQRPGDPGGDHRRGDRSRAAGRLRRRTREGPAARTSSPRCHCDCTWAVQVEAVLQAGLALRTVATPGS